VWERFWTGVLVAGDEHLRIKELTFNPVNQIIR